MNGKHHSMVGASAGASVAALSGHGVGWIVAGALIAGATSAGPTSPDMDQDHRWRRLDGATPDEELGAGGPMKHRGITHWFMWPVLAMVVLASSDFVFTVDGSELVHTEGVLFMAIVGWASHVVMDALFGQGGVPLLLWTCKVGLGLPQDGVLAAATAWAAVCVALAAVMKGLGIVT